MMTRIPFSMLAIWLGCYFAVARPASAAILSARAFVFGTNDVEGPSSDPAIEARVEVPGGQGIGVAGQSLQVGAQGFSNALGVAVTAGGSGGLSSAFNVLGNPLGKPLPLQFHVALSGNMEIEPLDAFWSASTVVVYSVGVTGVVVSSGTASFPSNFSFTQLNLFGDFTPDQFDTSFAGNPKAVGIDAVIQTGPATVTNSGFLTLSLNTSAIGGNAVATTDFLDGLALDSVSLPPGFSDPDVDFDNLSIEFDNGLVVPVQIQQAVIPEPSAVLVWSLLCGLGGAAWCRRGRAPHFDD